MSSACTGVFGGTFNPIHLGHLRAAEEVREALGLERMVFVPCADPPLKRGGEEVIAPAALRLEWVRLATVDNPRFSVDSLELERAGPSYTVDTLRALGERLGPEKLVFVMGRDAFVDLPSWREPGELLGLSHFAVTTRPGSGGSEGGLADWMPAELAAGFHFEDGGNLARRRGGSNWIRRLEISALEISSTEVRRRIRAGRSIRYLVPEVCRSAILASRVYAADDDGGTD
jgi:nicotinate-nucleotide adenylyltransferase